MATTVNLPALGEGIDVAEVIALRVAEDDHVTSGDTLLEVESGKSTIELPSPAGGTVGTIHVAVGDSVHPGDPLLELLGEDGEDDKDGEDDENGDGDDGDDAPPADAPPDAEDAKDTSPKAAAPEGDSAPAKNTKSEKNKKPPDRSLPPAAAPSVRRLARELGVDLAQIAGDGGSRISADAVRAAAQKPGQTRSEPSPDPDRAAPASQPLSRRRRQIAAVVTQSWQQIPHVFQQLEVDLTDSEQWRQTHNQEQAPHLSLSVLVIRAMVEALGEHPRFNASLDGDSLNVHQHADINIAIAADGPDGLLAPVLHRAQGLSLEDCSAALHELIAQARDGSLSSEDLTGATITLSNLGPIGGGFFTPLITSPQVAAIGLGQANILPRYHDGGLFPRLIMPLTLSYDHRIADGADGVRFAQAVVRALETPPDDE